MIAFLSAIPKLLIVVPSAIFGLIVVPLMIILYSFEADTVFELEVISMVAVWNSFSTIVPAVGGSSFHSKSLYKTLKPLFKKQV